MKDTVYCKHFNKQLKKLEKAPMPGSLGMYILENISQEAWQEWLIAQTKYLNENKLNPILQNHRSQILQYMRLFFNIQDC